MFEIIAVAAIKAITNYFVTAYLKNNYGSIEIEGAPYWYGRNPSGEICVSDATKGDVLELDKEKKVVKVKLANRLSNLIQEAIHTSKRFSHLKPDEAAFLNSIIKDKKIKWFVDSKGYYKNIKVDEDKKMIFVRMCVNQQEFIAYETNRIKTLAKEITLYKAKKGFDELEGKKMNSNDNESKAFDELESGKF